MERSEEQRNEAKPSESPTPQGDAPRRARGRRMSGAERSKRSEAERPHKSRERAPQARERQAMHYHRKRHRRTTEDIFRASVRAWERASDRQSGSEDADSWIGVRWTPQSKCSANVAYIWNSTDHKPQATGELKECGHPRRLHGPDGCNACPRIARHHTFQEEALRRPPRVH